MSLFRRLSDWSSEDKIVGTTSDEVDTVKVKSYYDMLRQYTKQAAQIWVTYKKEDITITLDDLFENKTQSFLLQKAFPAMPTILIEDLTCCTPEYSVIGPITISDGTRTFTIKQSLPANGTMEIFPDKTVKINGAEIRWVISQIQNDESQVIPLGQVSQNKELMQVIEPTEEEITGIVFKFNKTVGNPVDDLFFEIWELDDDLNLLTKVFYYEIENSIFDQYLDPFTLEIPFNGTLDSTKKYGIKIERELENDNSKYFVFNCSNDKETGKLMSWDGKEWVETKKDLYFEIKTNFISGEYPVIKPGETPSQITIGCTSCVSKDDDTEMADIARGIVTTFSYPKISIDTIYCRSQANPFYPLAKMAMSVNGTEQNSMSFKEPERYNCYILKTDPSTISTIPYNLEDLIITLETAWHYFDKTVTIGFPKKKDSENELFLPNESLDKIAKGLGMFRREYREDLQYYEYEHTYPLGYPYPIEQDYWLEKRLLNEYVRREDVVDSVFLYSEDNLKIIELSSKIPSAEDVEIYTKANTEGLSVILVNTFFKDRTSIQESYTFEKDASTLVDLINSESEILVAKCLNNADSLLLNKVEIIQPQGIYGRFGLLASEIYGYLGVYPTIKDMVDYTLIWDKRTWGNWVWGGGDYLPGVYRVDIPYPSPSNFKSLEAEEIEGIISRCQKLGTRGLFAYTTETSATLALETSLLESGYEIDVEELELYSYTCVRTEDPDTEAPSFVCFPPLEASPSIEVDTTTEMEYEFDGNVSIEISASASMIFEALSLDTVSDFKRIGASDLVVRKIGDNPYVTIDTETTNTVVSTATTGWNQSRKPTTLPWYDPSKIYASGYAHCKTATAWVETDYLMAGGFNLDIPDNAKVIGINIRMSVNANQTNTSPIWCRNEIRTANGIGTKAYQIPTPSGWVERNIGTMLDTWGLNLKGSDINGDNLKVGFIFGAVQPGYYVQIDWVRVTVAYKIQEGTFVTQLIEAPPQSSPSRGEWVTLKQQLTYVLPEACSVTYDVIREGIDQSQLLTNSLAGFGTVEQQKLFQTFVPTNSKITGISVYSEGKTGHPSDDVILKVYNISGGKPTGNAIQESRISALDWAPDTWVNFSFDLELTAKQQYGFTIERSGNNDSSNYCSVGYQKANVYSSGNLMTLDRNGAWQLASSGESDLAFKIHNEIPILSNISAPYDMSEVPYTDIKIRGRLKTNNINYSPKLDKLTLDREVYRDD